MNALRPLVILFASLTILAAQIPVPKDAPAPLSPEESARQVKLPPGFRLELVASEPLVREPSGVCWDEYGRMYVSELHGYNLEGQYDIDELNKTGKLDRVVRRIQANDRAKKDALKETYGTIKLLTDRNGDGRMDEATVFADRLPPAYGVCPTRGGIIVACAPDVIFLADRDGDGKAEVREKLFTGFRHGLLERGINAPQWGLDNWIYIGSGLGGGDITGSNLPNPVRIGRTDFRIKADGSTIEAVAGSTHTFGHAFGPFGERFVVTTSQPGRYVAPIEWRYLARNPDAATPRLEQAAGSYSRVFPIAPPHPWRTRRAEDPGFYKYYRDRYGAGDSEAGGYFTSGCGPLVYQDVALPEKYRGNYFFCEPAGNLVHRALIEHRGPEIHLQRPPEEQKSEFLASGDQWFHPMHLIHGPEGAIYVVDMYREIIEDYSAIPRYLQQQYGLTNGISHGRIWRLTHDDAPKAPSFNMSKFGPEMLARETASPHFWRRQTARRLLVERKSKSATPILEQVLSYEKDPMRLLNVYYTLKALGSLKPSHVKTALNHKSPYLQLHGLRFSEPFLDSDESLRNQVLGMPTDGDGWLTLQLALTLGETRDPRAVSLLSQLARKRGNVSWMSHAVLSSVHGRSGLLLSALLSDGTELGHATSLLETLSRSIGARRNNEELGQVVSVFGTINDSSKLLPCIRGLNTGLKGADSVQLSASGRQAITGLLSHEDPEVRRRAAELLKIFQSLDPEERRKILARAARDAADLKLSRQIRLAAVSQLAIDKDPTATRGLLNAWASNTPSVREAILRAVFSRRDRLPALVDALESGKVSPAALTAFQRVSLLENENSDVRQRAGKLFAARKGVDDATFQRFAKALDAKRDQKHGETVFKDHCATCHKLRGIGFVVGPDLGAEFQRAEEAILRDILAPNDIITAGYATYLVDTTSGQSFNGILASESATSVTLRQPTGLEQVILRKNIKSIEPQTVSLMPEALVDTLSPKDVADVIAWMQSSGNVNEDPGRVTLFDDEAEFLTKLTQGGGKATLEKKKAHHGNAFLNVTPPQRYSPSIVGWGFRIREKPGKGEYRYMRLAWRASGEGVMVELAASGGWPDPEDARRRYYSGKNTTKWEAQQVSTTAPRKWQTITVDLWKDNGEFTLTGIAPTAMGNAAQFDKIELLRDLRVLED